MTTAIPADDLATYRTQGFLHVPGLFAASLDALRTDLAALHLYDQTWLGPWIEKGARGRLGINSQVHRQPAWERATRTPKVRALMDALLGGPSYCQASMAIVKPKAKGQPFPWHQDAAYYGDRKLSFVIANVYLDDVTADNGSIQFIPGSHTAGLLVHAHRGSAKRYLPDETGRTAVDVLAKAGDATLFDLFTVHGSQPNTSDTERRSVRLVYQRS